MARQVLDYAVELNLIPFNPFSQIKIDGKRMFRHEPKKPSETQVFSREEEAALEKLAWDDFYNKKHPVNQLASLAMLFQFQTGLRIGELCVVKYEDIQDDKIVIRRMYRDGSDEVVEDTKGTFGERTVVLTDKAVSIIKAADDRKRELGIENEYIYDRSAREERARQLENARVQISITGAA